MTRTLLIDGNNLLARAHHASLGGKVEMFANGTNTSALVIFIGLISKYVRQVQPDRMAVLWDAGHALRDAAYPAYKAARAKPEGDGDSMPLTLAKEFLTWACVPHKAHQGYEADDLIAATARQTPGEVVILSGDKDLLQLIDDRRGVTQIRVPDDQPWTEVDVERKFGVPPHLLSHYLALLCVFLWLSLSISLSPGFSFSLSLCFSFYLVSRLPLFSLSLSLFSFSLFLFSSL